MARTNTYHLTDPTFTEATILSLLTGTLAHSLSLQHRHSPTHNIQVTPRLLQLLHKQTIQPIISVTVSIRKVALNANTNTTGEY